MKFDVAVFGHTTIDFFFQGKSLTKKTDRFFLAIGGKYFADAFAERVGGGGANVAIGIARHKLSVGLISDITSPPFDSIIKNRLDKEGVDYSFCREAEDEYNISCILLDKNGEKTVIAYTTPNKRFISAKRLDEVLESSRNFYFANLQEVPLIERIEILKKIKDKGGSVFSNLGVADCRRPYDELKEFFKYVDVVIQNTWEFADIVKKDRKQIDFSQNLQEIYGNFAGKILVITDGRRGSWAYFESGVYHQKAEKVKKIIDATGAGDAFTAGFISGFIKTKDIKKAMKAGSKYAAEILGRLGAN